MSLGDVDGKMVQGAFHPYDLEHIMCYTSGYMLRVTYFPNTHFF